MSAGLSQVLGVKQMLDRRSDREIQQEIEQARAARLSQLSSAGQEIFEAIRAHTHMVQFLVVVGIISVLVAILLPNFLQAKQAAYVTTCLEKLRQLGLAMEMYRMDFDEYPPAEQWYAALARPMSAAEKEARPFKCQLDRTADPTSYFYIPYAVLPPHQRQRPPTDIPMLVDELYHPTKTTILWYDGHQTAVDKFDWISMRREEYQIRRDPEHPEWFFFVPSPAASSEQGTQP